MMKKLAVLALTLGLMLVLATSAFAIQAPYTHGDFAAGSKGCGDCHVTHSADVQKLLRAGYNNESTQTALCLSCHGAILSPFDVVNGEMQHTDKEVNPATATLDVRFGDWGTPGTDTEMSYAGGFSKAGNFTMQTNSFDLTQDVTSVHNVRGINIVGAINGVTTYEYVYGNTIPGGTGSLDFECGSCHDPHAGGDYVASGKNPRLLKPEILGRTGLAPKMTIDQNTNLPTAYGAGWNQWCGACHNVFDTSGLAAGALQDGTNQATHRSGYYALGANNYNSKYMHLFGIDIDTSKFRLMDGADASVTTPYVPQFLAMGAGGKEVMCLTCHRAHGSSAPTKNTWKRYDSYNGYSGGPATNAGSGSALLRLPDRDVCYACHGAAEYNHSLSHPKAANENL